jgi:hypothetical protein
VDVEEVLALEDVLDPPLCFCADEDESEGEFLR